MLATPPHPLTHTHTHTNCHAAHVQHILHFPLLFSTSLHDTQELHSGYTSRLDLSIAPWGYWEEKRWRVRGDKRDGMEGGWGRVKKEEMMEGRSHNNSLFPCLLMPAA